MTNSNNIIVLDGDGFCGWPTVLHLSNRGHEVVIVDNFSRRKIDRELGVQSLTPIRPLDRRLSCWQDVTGQEIKSYTLDIAED